MSNFASVVVALYVSKLDNVKTYSGFLIQEIKCFFCRCAEWHSSTHQCYTN